MPDIAVLLQIPAFAAMVFVIVQQARQIVKKDKHIMDVTTILANFATKFERQATLLELLIQRDGGATHDRTN